MAKQATAGGNVAAPAAGRQRIALVPLIAATYFMVCGGPYGIEDLVHDAGYLAAIAVLLVTPVLWSLPTALLVGELSAALPEEGGYYAWVRRALGPFWGFQEAWLSLAASVFDMAIYPTLLVSYLGRLIQVPDLEGSPTGLAVGVGVVATCAAANVCGVRAVGGSSVALAVVLLGPFAVLVVLGLLHSSPTLGGWGSFDLVGAVLVAMWNYMGWDNASTIAAEVERPARTYPRAMLGTLGLVAVSYVLPVLAVSGSGIQPEEWSTGSWPEVAGRVAGPALALAVAVGGMVSGLGTFNALVLSYSRVPVVLAADGYLPAVFRHRHPRTGAPWVSVTACAVAWALALPLGFKRLVALDVILYGTSLLLEFVALVCLRLSEPQLRRPFRVPGGKAGAALLGVGPALLLVAALLHERGERAGPIPSLLLGAILMALGPVVYLLSRRLRRRPAAR